MEKVQWNSINKKNKMDLNSRKNEKSSTLPPANYLQAVQNESQDFHHQDCTPSYQQLNHSNAEWFNTSIGG